MCDRPTDVKPGDDLGFEEILFHLRGDELRQLVTLAVGLGHALEKPDRLPDRVEVLGRDILRAHAQVLELADRAEYLLADGMDPGQKTLIGRSHSEGIYLRGRLERQRSRAAVVNLPVPFPAPPTSLPESLRLRGRLRVRLLLRVEACEESLVLSEKKIKSVSSELRDRDPPAALARQERLERRQRPVLIWP